MTRERLWGIAAAAILLSAITVSSARAELGWTESDYAKQFGAPERAALTPDQARFTGPGGGSVLVLFAAEHSVEEAWSIDRDASFVPPDLMKRAQQATKGQPIRHVTFRRSNAPAADIFEVRDQQTRLQVDYRNGGVIRIVRCPADKACTMIDNFLRMELATDELLARMEAQMRREGH